MCLVVGAAYDEINSSETKSVVFVMSLEIVAASTYLEIQEGKETRRMVEIVRSISPIIPEACRAEINVWHEFVKYIILYFQHHQHSSM